jgi:hypothetical protein
MFTRRAASAAMTVIVLTALTGCAQDKQAELDWARAALERNPQVKVLSVDTATNSIQVRVKISGEVMTLTPGELAAIPVADLVTPPAPPPPPVADAAPTPPAAVAPAEAPAVVATEPTAEPVPESAPTYTVQREDGRVRVSGPGISIETAPKTASTNTEGDATRYDEPIICDGRRFLHLDNRTLNIDGDALTARGGCELHITNSRITATGTALTVLDATVHISNSTLQGGEGSLTTSSAARVFMRGNQFKGLARRSADAKIQDQGGNTWR